ncbi:GGDEF domain containing protein [Sphingobium amiense]|uniref:diguanylate cyclase n=1 Tax=Sphingobium amiense TaxID=135719 RepID=A0A494VZC6_9SPHN|nr:GGDEF domain-containing protein [Sphingobium amiense]BBD97783.1 GGDEF domain containing protein [Sphingobium amiense]
MNAPVILLALLFGTALVMTIALAVAWQHFGRQRHVLTWTASYAVGILQWAANAGGYFLKSPPLYILTGIGLVVSGSLLAIGVRQRSGRPLRIAAFAVPGVTVVLAMAIAIGTTGSQLMQGFIIPAYVGGLLAVSALSLWPRERRFTPPERAFFAALLLFAVVQLALAASALLIRGPEDGKQVYRLIFSIFTPTNYVATAVTAVLLVAGDLAQQLGREIRHDALTQVLNRRGLEEAAQQAMALAVRHRRPLALVVCDLDGFKALNDGHGHIVGDQALAAFARLLASTVRRGDVVARMGGDEFGLLLIDTDARAAADVMERVRAEVANLSLARLDEPGLRASFGVAELRSGDASLEDMVARADAALYMAKNGGRDRVTIWREAA